MKRSVLLPLPLALAVTALFASAVAPACGNPGEEDASAEDTGEDAYTTEGTCDGLPRLKNLKTPAGVCVGVVSTGFTFARGIAQLDTGDFVIAEMGGWAKDRARRPTRRSRRRSSTPSSTSRAASRWAPTASSTSARRTRSIASIFMPRRSGPIRRRRSPRPGLSPGPTRTSSRHSSWSSRISLATSSRTARAARAIR